MKKIRIGIVAEYNPFHYGHVYQINQIKQKWPNSYIIVIMSGKYVQRGEIAVATFDQRKNIALNYGIDEVIELDFFYATQAAHIFAHGAIMELNKYNIDYLVFGSETSDINSFIQAAQTIKKLGPAYYEMIKKEMKKGISFPKANQLILEKLIGNSFILPNDILGLEYVKTIINNDLNIKPYCFKRSIGFHSLNPINNIASATYIRKLIFEDDKEYQKYTPMVFDSIPDKVENHYQEFQKIVINLPVEELRQIKLMSEGMENLFKKNINAPDYESFVNQTNSKRYTSSRIKRVMLYVLLGIKNTI